MGIHAIPYVHLGWSRWICNGFYFRFKPCSWAVGSLLTCTAVSLVYCRCHCCCSSTNMSFSIRLLLISVFLVFAALVSAQSSGPPQTPPPTTSTPPRGNGTTTRPPEVAPTGSSPPDVLLRVPELHVGRIELIVEKYSGKASNFDDIAD